MPSTFPPVAGRLTSKEWGACAGLYLFVCATATAFALSDILGVLASTIGLPSPFAMLLLAAPSLVFGGLTWWRLVERRRAYTYLAGGVVGLVTALLTGLFWTIRFTIAWGVEMLMVPMIALLVLLVLGIATGIGVVVVLPLTYVRRRALATHGDESGSSMGRPET